MPLGLDQGLGAVCVASRLGETSPARSGAISRGRRSAAAQTADMGPPVPDEHVYRVVDAIDVLARETGKTTYCAGTAAAATDRRDADHRRAQRSAAARKSRRNRMSLTKTDRRLDAASEVTLALSLLAQRATFIDRNPRRLDMSRKGTEKKSLRYLLERQWQAERYRYSYHPALPDLDPDK